jgi:hypothetical protein
MRRLTLENACTLEAQFATGGEIRPGTHSDIQLKSSGVGPAEAREANGRTLELSSGRWRKMWVEMNRAPSREQSPHHGQGFVPTGGLIHGWTAATTLFSSLGNQ